MWSGSLSTKGPAKKRVDWGRKRTRPTWCSGVCVFYPSSFYPASEPLGQNNFLKKNMIQGKTRANDFSSWRLPRLYGWRRLKEGMCARPQNWCAFANPRRNFPLAFFTIHRVLHLLSRKFRKLSGLQAEEMVGRWGLSNKSMWFHSHRGEVRFL